MSIDVGEILIRSHIRNVVAPSISTTEPDGVQSSDLVDLKKSILSDCKMMIHQALDRQKER